jgi:hypothetical protein
LKRARWLIRVMVPPNGELCLARATPQLSPNSLLSYAALSCSIEFMERDIFVFCVIYVPFTGNLVRMDGTST